MACEKSDGERVVNLAEWCNKLNNRTKIVYGFRYRFAKRLLDTVYYIHRKLYKWFEYESLKIVKRCG